MISGMRTPIVALLLAFGTACSQAPHFGVDETLVSIPFDYDVLTNVTYVHRPNWEGKLDLLLPASRNQATPTLVWFHGGGWTRSSKDQELLYVLPYLYRRWSIVNVEYRLADVANAPAAANDGLCAMRWLEKHASEHRIQLEKLAVSGISAGGTMALIAGTMPAAAPFGHDCAPDSEFGTLPVPRVIVNWFGPSDLPDLIDGPHRHSQVATWFENVPSRIDVAKALSPVEYIHSRVPPVITIHGEHDADVPYEQSVALHKVLDSVGTPNRLVKIQNAGHGDFTHAQAAYAFQTVFQYVRHRS